MQQQRFLNVHEYQVGKRTEQLGEHGGCDQAVLGISSSINRSRYVGT
jgi:hypothetical protein